MDVCLNFVFFSSFCTIVELTLTKESYYIGLKKGIRLKGTLLSAKSTESLVECSRKCLEDPLCKGYKYSTTGESICRRITSGHTETLESSDGNMVFIKDQCKPNKCFDVGGVCVTEIDSYRCECVPGFTGCHCENDIDECASDPCHNNGTCVDGLGGYTCHCGPDFFGDRCEHENGCYSGPCENGGVCSEGHEGAGTFMCLCPAGYTGSRCESAGDPCVASPCLNDGTCSSSGPMTYSFTCAVGYTGRNCDVNIDDCEGVTCQNDGTCTDGVNSYQCDCAEGFTGSTCDVNIDDCQAVTCQHGGTCVDGVDSFTCSCSTGFSGEHCENNIDDCHGNPCDNGGTCSDGINSYSCACVIGYTGNDCDTNIDDCDPSPCLNNGTCTDEVNSYSCGCVSGFEGRNCETNVNDCDPDPCGPGKTCVDEVGSHRCESGDGAGTVQQTCPGTNPCLNGGVCVDGASVNDPYTCECTTNYNGATCGAGCPASDSWNPPQSWGVRPLPAYYINFDDAGCATLHGDAGLQTGGKKNKAVVTTGSSGSYASLDGISGVTCLWAPDSCPSTGASFSAWFNIASCGSGAGVMSMDGSGKKGFAVYCSNGNALKFQIKQDSDHKYRIDGNSFIPNTWFHIVLAFKGPSNGMSVYLDKVVSTQTSSSSGTANNGLDTLVFGRRFNDASGKESGVSVDEWMFWGVELTQGDVDVLYDSSG